MHLVSYYIHNHSLDCNHERRKVLVVVVVVDDDVAYQLYFDAVVAITFAAVVDTAT